MIVATPSMRPFHAPPQPVIDQLDLRMHRHAGVRGRDQPVRRVIHRAETSRAREIEFGVVTVGSSLPRSYTG